MTVNISATPEWEALQHHAAELKAVRLRDLFKADPGRVERFTTTVGDLVLDWSRHLVTDRTIELLLALAQRAEVSERIAAVLGGEPVNVTENRPALHTALRAAAGSPALAAGVDVGPAVRAEFARMARLAWSVRSGERVGATGRPIKIIVNLGIGGSHSGPVMAYEALAAWRDPQVRCRFVANADGADLAAAVAGLDPAETLFVVVSKSFTTAETVANARSARAWLTARLGDDAVERHFVGVTAAPQRAAEFGISAANSFTVWDWVGGRYSLASAAGLSLMVAIGQRNFRRMLDGMRLVDRHLAAQPLAQNGPVLLALLGVWYRNFWGLPARAVLPYSQRLHLLPSYLQQLDMESNGKRVRLDGTAVDYDTGPVVFGQAGTLGQHSFHQLLHQGTTVVPADFIVFARADSDTVTLGQARASRHHSLLVAHCLAQAAVLAFGSDPPAGRSPRHAHPEPHLELPGSRPSTLLMAAQLTPAVLGQLIALYEHQVLVQGAIWQVNSFDQFGVESGKRLAASILRPLRDSVDTAAEHDQLAGEQHHDLATLAALRRLRRLGAG